MTPKIPTEAEFAQMPSDGSTLYYSLLNLPEKQKVSVLSRLQLIHAISSTLDDVTDAGVAHQKVHWWHEELARLATGKARHPATVANGGLAGKAEAEAVLLDILAAAADDRFSPPSDDKLANSRMQRHTGAALALVSHALSGKDTILTDTCSRYPTLANAVARFNQLQRLPMRLRLGYSVFSAETYTRFNTTPEALVKEANKTQSPMRNLPAIEDDNIRALLDAAIDQTGSALDEALAKAPCIPTNQHDHHLPIAIWASLRQAQLRQWQSLRPNLLQGQVSLTPLRKTWIMWQTRRQWIKASKLLA